MGRWVDDICDAFRHLGGEASYDELYAVLQRHRHPPVAGSWRATVRRTVEDNSRDSANFRGVHLFDHVATGRWRLTSHAAGSPADTLPMEMARMTEHSTYEAFRETWLEDVRAGNPSTVKLGHRFAEKIVSHWLDADETALDIVYCDGAGDGGIDIAVLERGSAATDEDAASGDVWYLVQSKYGSAFAGTDTLLAEAQKVIDTLDGRRSNLSSLATGLLERITNFRNGASASDQIVLIFATIDPLSESEKRALEDIRAMGRNRLGAIFDVSAISLRTIFDRLAEEAELAARRRLTVPLSGNLVDAGDELLVGSVSLVDLYGFLKEYRARTSDLDQLFEKNVRRFLGGKVKVNKGMQATLREAPERFGLYNNGITIVVSGYEARQDGGFDLVEPYVVNGCQTTRTIWEVCYSRFDTGGTGENPELEDWRCRAKKGCVVTKVAKVGNDGEELLQAVTRYTNSQNAVRDKDFIALSGDFRSWHGQFADRYDVYLEIQRGGWDSQRALQKQRPSMRSFERHANATELVKVYGAGWLGEAGTAFGKNPPFLPNGSVFKRITSHDAAAGERAFGAEDLYAAYLLQQAGQRLEFGRGGPQTRRQTKFLFYFVTINLLRDVLQKANLDASKAAISSALIKLLDSQTDGGEELATSAVQLIDSYMSEGDENSVFNEPAYRNSYNFDLNAFLKWERLGKNLDETPCLQAMLFFQKQFMGRSHAGAPSARAIITNVLSVGV